jgi:hypothetical protein
MWYWISILANFHRREVIFENKVCAFMTLELRVNIFSIWPIVLRNLSQSVDPHIQK